ncbi:hypothetical protein COTS27_00105 [Spirochaetota bacterium]|nr:hypothetical protein COTS27_00105 [Spirochaetota bacterium]
MNTMIVMTHKRLALHLIMLGVVVLMSVGYAQRVEDQRVEAYDTSQIGINFQYSFEELQESLDEMFSGVIYVDESFENNSNDNILAEVRKDGAMRVYSADDYSKLYVTIPLDIEVVYKFDEAIRGKILWWRPKIQLKEHKELKFKVLLKFELNPLLDNALKLRARTKVSFDWITYPYVSFYYIFRFRVQDQVGGKLQSTLDKNVIKRIDEYISERVDVRKFILNFQRKNLNRPILLDEETLLWAVANRSRAKVSQLTFDEKNIYANIYFTFRLDLFWDEDGARQFSLATAEVKNFAPSLTAKQNSNNFTISTPVRLGAAALQGIIAKRIVRNPVLIQEGKNTIRVREIYLKFQDNSMVFDAYLETVTGNNPFEMVATVTATPMYLNPTASIELINVDYNLESDSFFLSLWSSANKKRLKQTIIENVRLPVSQLASDVKKMTEKALSKLSFYSIGDLDVNLNKVTIENVFMEENYIIVLVDFKGTITVSLKDLF